MDLLGQALACLRGPPDHVDEASQEEGDQSHCKGKVYKHSQDYSRGYYNEQTCQEESVYQ